jgi:ribosomal protein S27E
MAQWVLSCTGCGAEVSHSPVVEVTLAYGISVKPEFPPGGLQVRCPNCHESFTYQRYELYYSKSTEARREDGTKVLRKAAG